MGNLKRIEIPRDRGEEGRPGALKGRRQQSQDEVDANSETDSDEGDEGLEADGDDNFDQGGDEDAWTEIEGLETVDLVLNTLHSLRSRRQYTDCPKNMR